MVGGYDAGICLNCSLEDYECPEVCIFCDLKKRCKLHHPIINILQLVLFCLILTSGQSPLDQFPSTTPLKIFDNLRFSLVLMYNPMFMHELMIRLVKFEINILRLFS